MAAVFVNFNDTIKAGQAIAQLDPEIVAACVNEAKAALRVARATAQVEKAALERGTVAVTNAQTAKKLAEAQSAANKARQDEVERDLLRKLELARTGSGTERDLSQVRSARRRGCRPARFPRADPDERGGHCDCGSRKVHGRRQSRECTGGCRAEAGGVGSGGT